MAWAQTEAGLKPTDFWETTTPELVAIMDRLNPPKDTSWAADVKDFMEDMEKRGY